MVSVWQCPSVCSLLRFVKADENILCDKAVVLFDTIVSHKRILRSVFFGFSKWFEMSI